MLRLISIQLLFLFYTGSWVSLSLGVLQSKFPTPLSPHPTSRYTPTPKKRNFKRRTCMHPPTHPKTMMMVAAEDNRNFAWSSKSTTFGRKMLSKMGWKDGGGLRKSCQGMNTNLQAYLHSNKFRSGGYYRPAWKFGVVRNER